jgi:hypothetical protein
MRHAPSPDHLRIIARGHAWTRRLIVGRSVRLFELLAFRLDWVGLGWIGLDWIGGV